MSLPEASKILRNGGDPSAMAIAAPPLRIRAVLTRVMSARVSFSNPTPAWAVYALESARSAESGSCTAGCR